jgi:hypothetical protein
MKTEILKIKGNWEEVVNDCRATVKKEALGREPSTAWKRKILISEHDPIRDIEIKFRWRDIPYWVAMHFKTHIWRSRTNSQRNDRQSEYDRTKAPQEAPVDFIGDVNAQHGIDTGRKRLCFQASEETRKKWEDLKVTIHKVEPEIAESWVPNCVYRCGCPEMTKCPLANHGRGLSYWELLVEKTNGGIMTPDIQERYDLYNAIFFANRGPKEKDGQYGEG